MAIPTPENEEELIKRAQAGDAHDFGLLVNRYRERLGRFCRTFVGDADVDDVIQWTLLRAWHGLPRFRLDSAFLTWLFRIAERECQRHLRRRHVWLVPNPGDQAPEGLVQEDAEDTAISNLASEELVDRLEQLPAAQRDVLWLTIQGYSDAEIGKECGMNPSTVRSHRRRGRKTLARESSGGDAATETTSDAVNKRDPSPPARAARRDGGPEGEP